MGINETMLAGVVRRCYDENQQLFGDPEGEVRCKVNQGIIGLVDLISSADLGENDAENIAEQTFAAERLLRLAKSDGVLILLNGILEVVRSAADHLAPDSKEMARGKNELAGAEMMLHGVRQIV